MRPSLASLTVCVGVAVAACVLTPTPARADCMASSPFLSPPRGASLPPNPVLYAFIPEQFSDPQVSIASQPPGATVEHELVWTNESFAVLQLGVRQASGSFELSLEGEGGDVGTTDWGNYGFSLSGSYVIDPAWTKPAGDAVELSASTEAYSWSCSHNLTHNLAPSVDAIAYRLEYAKSANDYRAGIRQAAFYPKSMDQFFGPDDAPGHALIKLGHVDCFTDTFWWPAPAVYAGLVALHPDGSETPAAANPVELPRRIHGRYKGAITDEYYKAIHGYPPNSRRAKRRPRPTPPPVAPSSSCSVEASSTLGSPLTLLSLLALFGARRKRTDAAPRGSS